MFHADASWLIVAPHASRYDWKLLQTLVAFYLDKVLVDYEAEQQVEVSLITP